MRKARGGFAGREKQLIDILPDLSHKLGHEIGNPLTSIISLATILERFAGDDPERNIQYARSIIGEAWKISGLVEKVVLLFSNRPGSPSDHGLDDIVRRALNKLKSRGNVAVDDIVLRIDEDFPPRAFCDGDQLCSVLVELISNAAQASPVPPESDLPDVPSDPITVRLYSVGNASCLEVSNPIAEQIPLELSALFDLLVTTSPNNKNLGIGLPMVAKTIEQAGGICELHEQKTSDCWYTFTALLALPSKESLVINADDFTTDMRKEPGSTNQQAEDATLPTELSVLVVEDQEVVASAIRKILEFAFKDKAEISCHCVSGTDAKRLLSSGEHFDAVLCDLNLPSVDGRALYQLIARERPQLLRSFAFMTGERRPTIEEGIPCLRKPFEPEELITLLVDLVEA